MKTFLVSTVAVIGYFVADAAQAQVSVAYSDPAGGWTYALLGDNRTPASAGAFDGLDGTWSNTNGSDSYDGSEIGGEFIQGNAPGGVNALTSGATNSLRFQDTGDPRDDLSLNMGLGLVDPTNRRIYYGHSITNDTGVTNPATIGAAVTLSFRARLATAATGPVDPMYPDTAANSENFTVAPGTAWPDGGSGTIVHDGGKGMFSIRQSEITDPNTSLPSPGAGVVSFSLTRDVDTRNDGTPYGTSGLTMNSLNGSTIIATVDPYQNEGTLNVLPVADLSTWHEFWITIQADQTGGGTHKVDIYVDGSSTPSTFHVTGGTGNDYGGQSYLAMGVGATPQIAGLDVDFFAYKEGAVAPGGGGGQLGDFDGDNDVDGNDFLVWQRDLVTAAKLTEWKDNYGTVPLVSSVPEPSAAGLAAWGAAAIARRRRRSAS